jgi:hypothetical protein
MYFILFAEFKLSRRKSGCRRGSPLKRYSASGTIKIRFVSYNPADKILRSSFCAALHTPGVRIVAIGAPYGAAL